MGSKSLVHVYLVSYPSQGNINPLLRLGKRLASEGLLVTFSVPESFGQGMRKSNNLTDKPTPVGNGFLRFEFYADESKGLDLEQYITHLEIVGRRVIPEMIRKNAEQGRPVSCLIYSLFIPWVSDIAEELGLPSAMLWVQSCACFAAYYHYSRGTVPFPSEMDPEIDIQLPSMPLLKPDEVPSFLHPTTSYLFLRRAVMREMKNVEKPFCILMDTFQELEHEVVDYMSKILPIRTVGPLFKNPKAECLTIRGDFLAADDSIMEWLDSKPASSVVYVSFGSMANLNQEQVDELAHGILKSGVSFLWVMKPPPEDSGDELITIFPKGFMDKVGDKGKVVQWSHQEKVLTHASIACFVTHCGWNSTVETIATGVPVVALPLWGDQMIDAKYLVDEWKMGIRMCRGEGGSKKITRDEVAKCLLDATVGAKAAEMKGNALKWKKAAAEGGSSGRNLEAFVDEVRRRRSSVSSSSN